MPSDAHCHPFDVQNKNSEAEQERRRLRVMTAASAWNGEEFAYHAEASRQAVLNGGPPMALCFGVHPQLPLAESGSLRSSLDTLHLLAEEKRLAALGEAGYDLFNADYKSTEKKQDELFIIQLELAKKQALPMVLHIRRAMHKVFTFSRELSALPAVVFHSYSGTYEEALALLKRGVPAFFSFGTTILLNHRRAMRACALLPPEVLLFETDAPYQPLHGNEYSFYDDIFKVVRSAALLRAETEGMIHTEEELHFLNDEHFRAVFL